jgi:hypothetical protein
MEEIQLVNNQYEAFCRDSFSESWKERHGMSFEAHQKWYEDAGKYAVGGQGAFWGSIGGASFASLLGPGGTYAGLTGGGAVGTYVGSYIGKKLGEREFRHFVGFNMEAVRQPTFEKSLEKLRAYGQTQLFVLQEGQDRLQFESIMDQINPCWVAENWFLCDEFYDACFKEAKKTLVESCFNLRFEVVQEPVYVRFEDHSEQTYDLAEIVASHVPGNPEMLCCWTTGHEFSKSDLKENHGVKALKAFAESLYWSKQSKAAQDQNLQSLSHAIDFVHAKAMKEYFRECHQEVGDRTNKIDLMGDHISTEKYARETAALHAISHLPAPF